MADLLDLSQLSATFNSTVSGPLDVLTQQPIASALTLFLVLYAGMAKPTLPQVVVNLFDKAWYRILVLGLILWTGNKNPSLSIAIALAFTVTMNMLAGRGALEHFEGPKTAIIPGCLDLKVYDLLAAYNGDKDALVEDMIRSRVPAQIRVDDDTAPLIATYLINHLGKTFGDKCHAPN